MAQKMDHMVAESPQSGEEDFCIIRPSLIKQLRSILDQYPDDGQILKELIQNAEDARAKKVCFLYDDTQHGASPDKLAHPELELHQGPALYAFNDAVFDDSDWKGIRMLQDSIKDKDPMKVGRFGLGFKSVFHMTDMPSVLSDRWLAFIDPHEKYFRFDGDSTTGFRYKLSSVNSEYKSRLTHQFDPYRGIFGCDDSTFSRGCYNGTLFRFPLRRKESDLSDTLYTSQKISELFASFERDAHLVLLFLKNVECVELCIRKKGLPIKTVFKVQVQDSWKDNVRAARHEFLAKLSPTSWLNKPAEVVYPLQVETLKYQNDAVVEKKVYTWLISEYFAGGERVSPELKALCLDKNLSNIPLVGVAFPLELTSPLTKKRKSVDEVDIPLPSGLPNKIAKKHKTESGVKEKGDDMEFEPEGQVFCFLPLPIEEKSSTGLPVHVNGYFSISQNRRHLKWPSQGQDFRNDKEILWNQCLLRELIPKAYVNLTLKTVELCKEGKHSITPEHMLLVLPDMMQVEMRERWRVILEPFYTAIFHYRVFYSPAEGSHWVSVSECVFDCLKERYETCTVIRKVLLSAGVKVVKIPQHVMLALGAYCTHSLEDITPELTRNWCLKRHPSAYIGLGRDEKLLLLAYILKDEDFPGLEGIVLLPTADNNFIKFTASGGSHVYVPNHDHPREVLRGLDHLLIADGLPETLMGKINKLAFEGSMQVKFLSKDIVLKLIPSTVPRTWYEQTSVIIQEQDSPTLDWLEALWNYLRQHTPQDLGMLLGCPILVLKKDAASYVVVPLALPSVIVLDGATGFHLASEVRKSLEMLGVRVISEVVPYIQSHAAVWGNFIRLPLPEDVLDCIVTAVKNDGQRVVEDMKTKTTAEQKRALCEFVGKADDHCVRSEHVKILSSLPLFETIAHGPDLVTEFVSVNEVNLGAPISLPEMKVNAKLLDLRKDSVRNLALKLNVKILTQAEFLTNVVFHELMSNLDPERLEQTLIFVIDNLHKLQAEKPDFVTHLQKLPFLASGNGKQVPVTELFDPDVELLKDLFYAEDKFPQGKFAESHFLIFLRQLGLKHSTDIHALDILTSALKVEEMKESEADQLDSVRKKSNALVKHLSENTGLLNDSVHGKLLKEWLCGISWMACMKERPAIFPDELDLCESQAFLTPGSLLPSETVPFAGCVRPICESSCARPVLKALGLPLLPSVTQVLLQMKKITEVYQPNDKAKYLQLIMSIYAHLEMEDVAAVERALLDIRLQDWVWYGDGFTNIDKVVACHTPMDLKPYLFSLPEESQMFEKMFREFGVRNKCCPRTLVTVLQDIKTFHTSSEQDVVVKARDLQLAVGILNLLKGQLKEVDDFVRQRIVIPVMGENESELTLLPVEECTYCDTEWLQQGIQSLVFEKTEGIIFVHPDVPLSTAEALNVPTLMSRMLRAEELSVTGFGQYETLTNRIRSLLEDYTDGYSIAKELVQNADDAGATVVKFLYDERSNFDNMTYLLDEGMKECQGPAFWAYNDAVFTDQDFENITKLGGATKEKEVDKIGKFGLGFNSVYNITDVPSFISGNHLVIFDPHTTHVGRSIRDRSKPGIKIDLKKNKTLIRKLPDQFHPYQKVFDCSINPDEPKEFKGTLFRFPLRTTRQAATSEISQQAYDKHEMMKLLSLFVRGSESLLLFTQHVSRIELHHISPAGGESVLLFSVVKEKMRTITPLLINPDIKFDVLKTCTSYFERLQGKQEVNEMVETSMAVEVQMDVTENGQAFFEHATNSSRNTWMLSYVFNMKQSLKALRKQFELGYCPYGAVAVPLTENNEDFIPATLSSQGMKGTLYCHLPLPIHTNLLVHINGSFAIQSNRRHLCEWTEDDKYSWKAKWNEFLLKSAVCPAYHLLLRDLVLINQSTKVEYVNLWPELSSAHPNLEPLVRAFYNDSFHDLVMVHNGVRHVTLKQAAIFEKSSFSNDEDCTLAVEVFKQAGAEHSIVNVPDKILETLEALQRSAVTSPQMFGKKRFLLEIFFPHMSALDSKVRNKVLLWAFELKDREILQTIEQTPCIPACPDGDILKKPSELIHLASKAAELFHNSEGRFVQPNEFKKPEVSNLLLKLGMKSDILDWESITERAHSVEQLFLKNPELAMTRAKLLLKYLDMKLDDEKRPDKTWTYEEENEFMNASGCLCEMKILPLAVPPKESPVKWRNWDLLEASTPVVSAAEACLSTQAALLCSTYPLVEAKFIPDNVQKFLGLQRKSATLDHVCVQFNAVLNLNPEELKKKRPESFKLLQSVCQKIYTFLRNECQKDQSGDLCNIIHDGFGQQGCILVEDRFVRPCDLAFNDKENAASPFLYPVPSDYFELTFLLKVLGVREHFEPVDYVRHLQKLKESYGEKPVRGYKLRSCMNLVSGLERHMRREGLSAEDVSDKIGTICVPNAAGVMMSSEELCFNNCPWLDTAPPANLVHPDITYNMSTALGVRTQIKEILNNHATGIPFGQSERLTTSLKRIIDNYPLDQEILKELVQNADDASATEIHFVLDPRMHGTGHVFEECWKPLQGPALCVYNNRPFTLRDLEGIQRLGEGSKGNDPCKTGQYGIGFSSMYHLTDAPSVLTTNDDMGDMLCVFDPHCYYVPGATKMAPGMRYTNLKMLRESFPDVFTGYLEKQFEPKNSTIFRFPLRTKEMAAKSEVSKNVVSAASVIGMFQKFRNEALEMLLFSNHLQSLKVSVIDNQTGMLRTEYGAYAYLSEEDKAKREAFRKACQRVGMQLKSGDIAIEDVKQEMVEYTLHLNDGSDIQEEWRISQVLGFSNKENVSEEVREAFAQEKLALLPKGGVACLLERRIKGQHTHKYSPGKVFCYLPMPLQTGMPVHVNGHFAMSFENRQQLWSSTGAEPNYKLSWNHLLCNEVIASAYVELLKSMRGQGLLASSQNGPNEFKCSKQLLNSALLAYQDYFPKFNEGHEDWSGLVKAVYSVMASLNAPLFPCVRECGIRQQPKRPEMEIPTWVIEWFPLCGEGNQKAFFSQVEVSLPEDNPKTTSFLDKVKNLFQGASEPKQKVVLKDVLRECGFNILEVNPSLVENITKSGVQVDCMSPQGVRVFFQSYSSPKPMCDLGVPLPSPLGQTKIQNMESLIEILKYCYPSGSSLTSLEGMPLLLTSDGMLRVFDSKIPVYATKHSSLFQTSGDLFVHEKLRQELFEKEDLNVKDLPLKKFTVEALAECLPKRLPEDYATKEEVPWRKFVCDITPESWVRELWTFVSLDLECKRYAQEDDDEYQVRLAVSKSRIEPLRNWCLLPARKPRENLLYQVGRAEEVVDIRNIPHEFHNLRDLISKLQIPMLDHLALSAGSTSVADFVRNFTANFNQPSLILAAVCKVYSEKAEVPLLTLNETQLFLEYFAINVEALKTASDAITQLKALPFYKTICGDVISLANCLVYVLPGGMLTEEMDSWQSKSGTVFLQKQDKLQPLFDFMGCATLGVLEVYCDFILQHFEYLSRDAQMAHLKHLFDTYLKDNATHGNTLTTDEKDHLLASLQDLSVIEDRDGNLNPASHYYDPENVLFSVMIEDDRLPPRAVGFRQSEWLSILRKLGLNSNVTPEMCVEFATKIAQEGQNPIGGGALLKSKALAQHILSPDLENRDEILKKVSDIPFIAPERVSNELSQLYPQYGDLGDSKSGLPYVSFKGSYSQGYTDVIWTCASILPKWADPHSQQNGQELCRLLNMDDCPSIDLVVHNFKTVCSAAHTNDNVDRQVLKRCCRKSYEFMQKHGFDNGRLKTAMQDLTNIACIAVGGKEILAQPCRTTMNIPEHAEMRPYLCKIPYEYGDYKLLFTALGASDGPRFDQYAGVLDMMHKKMGGGRLTPNELLLVYKALEGLFMSLSKGAPKDDERRIDSLSLLGENGCLCESTKLVFNDAPWLYDRVKAYKLRFLVDLKECGLKENPEELLALLPMKFRPEMLSSYVKEVLVEDSEKQLVTSGLAEKLQKRLNEKAFLSAVKRLARHQAHKTGQKLDDGVLYGALDNLSTINVYAAKEIYTHLLYKDKHVKGSRMEKKCFVHKVVDLGGTTFCNVYVKNDAEMGQDLLIPLAEALNSILNGILKDSVLFLLPILGCKEADINVCLNQLNVHSDLSQTVARMPTLPAPGSVVPEELHQFLQDAEPSLLKVGDFVVVKDADDKHVYAILRDSLPANLCRLDVGKPDLSEQFNKSLKILVRRH